MTLDQSLANLQHQADRLAGLFAATADAIEARTSSDARELSESFNLTPASPVDWTKPVIQPAAEARAEHTTAPQGAAPSSEVTAAPPAAAVEVEAPRPAAPVEDPFGEDPFEQAPAPAKKKGRRTHDELAADAGVKLDDVKAWLGEGGKVTKAAIEDFAAKHPDKVAMNNQTLADAAPAALPEAASDPFGNPGTPPPGLTPVQNSTGAVEPVVTQQPPMATVAPENPFGPDVDGNPVDPFGGQAVQMGDPFGGTPVATPPTPEQLSPAATPENPFGQAPGADEAITDWNPFQ